MKKWFIWTLAALTMAGLLQAGEEGNSEGKKKARGFAAVDTDGDGKVSMQEYVAFQQKKAEKAEKEFDAEKAEADFEAKDKDGDGFLSKSEMGGKKKAETEEPAEGEQE